MNKKNMNKLKFSLVIIIIAILMSESCKNSLKNDLSLTPEEYQKLGMPDYKKIWKFNDYIGANITIGSLKIAKPSSLPRRESKKSGVLFNKLVNKDNLAFAGDTALPLNTRAYMIQEFTRLPGELRRLYTDNSKERQYYDDELIDIDIFILSVHEQMLALGFKIMNSEDPADINLQSGFGTVKYNYLKTIERLLDEQVKKQAFPVRDLKRLSIEVSRSLKENHEWILPADRITISSKIQATIDKAPSLFIKRKYAEVLKIFKD